MKVRNLPKIFSELARRRAQIQNWVSQPYSRLYIVSDRAGWVLDEEAKEIHEITQSLGIKSEFIPKLDLNIPQVVHYTSQFSLLSEKIYQPNNRISVDYFHGKPDQGENFRLCFKALRKHQDNIQRIRVAHSEMEGVMKDQGINMSKVKRIPIGINSSLFPRQTEEAKRAARLSLDIPLDAVVIGSFQKDGVGWTDGLEPKLIKGPDTFLHVIKELKTAIPNLWVLLSGPARGYVKKGLEEIGIPYRHAYVDHYQNVSRLYDALDLYLITSREEGGPKACLEAMSKGVPLVTTAVGQCRDLVKHEDNGMIVPIGEEEGLREAVLRILNNANLRLNLVNKGITTAHNNNYESQASQWQEYFSGLINNL